MKKIILSGILGLLAVTGFAFFNMQVEGAVNDNITTQPKDRFVKHTFFIATTTSATSTTQSTNGTFRIAGAKKVTFYFGRGGATSANTGTSRFEVEVTPDGDNWYDFNRLVADNIATSTSAWTSTSTQITAATSTSIVSMELSRNAFYAVRCIVFETTDGEHSCSATAEY